DNGSEITVTTYANFYQNEELLKKDWDLIVYDESHYLGQNASGEETSYFEQHKEIANLPSAVRHRAKEMYEHLNPKYDGGT
ncbi:DEAD/DEAH box helicase family protein, partial [Streptococcus pyogenes]